MFDRFLVPYYGLWPIAFITFVMAFFLSTDSEVEITNKNYNISSIYLNSNLTKTLKDKIEETKNNIKIINQNDIEISDECIDLLKNIDKTNEIEKVDLFNLIIKITIFIIFGLVIINIICNIAMVYSGACYDEDTGGYCQNCSQFCSSEKDPNSNCDDYWCISIILAFLFCINFLICISSVFSLNYSSKFKNKMKDYCNFEFDTDYSINKWKASKILLGFILGLYLVEILLCIYSPVLTSFSVSQKIKINKNLII